MRLVWLSLFILVICIDAKGFFKFKTETLNNFNGARRLLGSGSLRTLNDIVNGILESFGTKKNPIPVFGPAANMHKLRWSAKLEHKAYEYGKKKGQFPAMTFDSFKYEGFVGFQWSGLLVEIAMAVLDFIPGNLVKHILKPILNILDKFLMAILLVKNYPPELPVKPSDNLGPTEALFAHRYEIGCYTKVIYSICFMEASRNGGYLYQFGLPCSNCTTHCEFFEDEHGVIEEGDLCEPPTEESNFTSSLVVKQDSLMNPGADDIFNNYLITFIIIAVILLKTM